MLNIENNSLWSSQLAHRNKKKKFLPQIEIEKAAYENDPNQIRKKLNNKKELRLLPAQLNSNNSKRNIQPWKPSRIFISKSRPVSQVSPIVRILGTKHSSLPTSTKTLNCFTPVPVSRTREEGRERRGAGRREEIYFYEKEQNSIRS